MYYEMKQILVTNGKVCQRSTANKTIFRSLSAFAEFKNIVECGNSFFFYKCQL